MDNFDELDHLDHYFSIDLDGSLRSLSTSLPPNTDLKSSFTSIKTNNTADLENIFLEMENEDPERLLDFIVMDQQHDDEQERLSTPTHDNRTTVTATSSHRPLKKRKTRGGGYTNSHRRVSCSSDITDNMESFSRAWLGDHNDDDELLCPPLSKRPRCNSIVTPPSSPVHSQQLIHCHNSSMADLRNMANLIASTPAKSNVTEQCQMKYHEALQNLAASMKRSDITRRQINNINSREDYMTKAVRENVLLSIEQQLQWASSSSLPTTSSYNGNEEVGGVLNQRRITHPTTGEDITNRLTQFFNGSRGTLTDGLEESRKQLRLYAAAVRRS